MKRNKQKAFEEECFGNIKQTAFAVALYAGCLVVIVSINTNDSGRW